MMNSFFCTRRSGSTDGGHARVVLLIAELYAYGVNCILLEGGPLKTYGRGKNLSPFRLTMSFVFVVVCVTPDYQLTPHRDDQKFTASKCCHYVRVRTCNSQSFIV